MREIAVGEAEIGDIVAEPVVNKDGRTLLPKGAKLSAAVLSRLVGWGVSRLRVEREGSETESDRSSSLHEALEHRFSEWEGDRLMMAIKEIAAGHLRRT